MTRQRAWFFGIAAMLAGLLGSAGPGRAAVDLLFLPRVEAEFAKGNTAAAFVMLEDAIRDRATAPETQADLLAELASRRVANGDFADAGEALALQAELTARLKGALAPEIASLKAAAAAAYVSAGNHARALDLAVAAIVIDRNYVDCASTILARDHGRLADILAALGRKDEAARERTLAEDADARCADAKAHPGSRGVVVENDIAGASPDSFARVKLFYATDRMPTGSDRPDDFFGGERGPMAYGTVEVTVPRIHKPGAIEAPSLIRLEWSENPERHFVVSRLATMDEGEMFADMQAMLRANESDAAFVFIHGFNVAFVDAAKRTAQIAYDLNFDGAPILYSWPSRANSLSYLTDEASIRLSGRHLLTFLEAVTSKSGAKRIYLIAHSMGNRALADALELLSTRRNAVAVQPPLFDQVVFAAPDEDAGLFAEMIKTIRPIARRLTLYGSANDLALRTSRELHGSQPRAGEGGDSLLIAGGLDSIDMSVLGDDMLGHSYFAASASALTDMLWLFWRNAAPPERCGMNQKAAARGPAWLFDPARCDGPTMLSALTLLKREGDAALAKIDAILAGLGSNPARARETEEWNAIRTILTGAMAKPR